MADPITELADAVAITDSRRAQLSLDRLRLTVNHSLVVHRDAVSARDVKAMIAHLEAAGMPGDATLQITSTEGHTRAYGKWSVVVSDVQE